MSVLSPDDIRLQMQTTLEDAALEEVIAGEEAWLARRIGPLVGERTQTFTPLAYGTVHLPRPTDAVEVTDDAVDTVVELRSDGRAFIRAEGAWVGTVEATYEPNDEAEVRRVVTELVRLAATSPGGYLSERIGEYSYTIDQSSRAALRASLWRSLMAPRLPSSMRLRSSVLP